MSTKVALLNCLSWQQSSPLLIHHSLWQDGLNLNLLAYEMHLQSNNKQNRVDRWLGNRVIQSKYVFGLISSIMPRMYVPDKKVYNDWHKIGSEKCMIWDCYLVQLNKIKVSSNLLPQRSVTDCIELFLTSFPISEPDIRLLRHIGVTCYPLL